MQMGEHLANKQNTELRSLLTEFSEVFSDKARRTDLVECVLVIKDKPCTQSSYRLPEALKVPVEDQLLQLLSDGFLIESDSEYSSPLVVIAWGSKKVAPLEVRYSTIEN